MSGTPSPSRRLRRFRPYSYSVTEAFADCPGIPVQRKRAAITSGPSRPTIFTGRYPHANDVLGLTQAHFGWKLHAAERHLGPILRDAGHRTAGVGMVQETHAIAQRFGLEEFDQPARAREAAAWEQRNLSCDAAPAGRTAQLRPRLLRHMQETGDPLLDGAMPCPMHARSMDRLRGKAQA